MCPNRMCATQRNLGSSVRKTVAVGPWQTWSLLAPLMTSFAVFLNFTFLYSLFLLSFYLRLGVSLVWFLSCSLSTYSCHQRWCSMQCMWWSERCKNWTAVRRSEWSLWAARLHSSGSTAPVSWTTCAWYVSPWLRRLQPFSDCCVWGL